MAYRNQHYVPQAYLKAWTDLNGKISIFHKRDKSLFKQSKTENVLYSPDLYTRRANDLLILTQEDFNFIFGSLKEYIIKLNGTVLESIEECAKQYDLFNEWEVFNKDGSLAKKKKLKHEIDQARITSSEQKWSQIENEWLDIKDKVEKDIANRKGEINSSDLIRIYSFMTAQEWRTPKAIHRYRDMIDTLMISLKEGLGESYEDMLDEFALSYFKKSIMKFQELNEKSHIKKEIDLIKEYTVVFYLADDNNKFYTSDSPVFFLIDDDFHFGRFNGMYFPITPNILCAIYKGNPSEYRIQKMSKDLIMEFNALIVDNSFQYFISLSELE